MRLRELRNQSGLTQNEIANKLGVSGQTILNWENGIYEPKINQIIQENDILCVEMESFGLFATAKNLGKNAACLLTISDSIVHHIETTSKERQSNLLDMIRIALEASVE